MQAQATHPGPTAGLKTDLFLIGIVAGALGLIAAGIVVAALGVGRGPTTVLDRAQPQLPHTLSIIARSATRLSSKRIGEMCSPMRPRRRASD